MRKQHVLQTMLTWMLIVCLGTRFVYADTTERPDLNRTVDLHLRLESVEEEVKREAGAEVCIYHIAEMQDLGGEITFVYTDDWADMSWDLSESVPVEKVREMSDLAEENALSGQSKVSDDNGDVVYYDLAQGVYLVTQTDTVERFMLSLSGCPQTKKETDSNKASGDNSVNDETEVDTTDENAESDSQPVEDEVYIIKSIARHYNSSGEPSSRFEYEYDALGNETKKYGTTMTTYMT